MKPVFVQFYRAVLALQDRQIIVCEALIINIVLLIVIYEKSANI